jgi:hypothetical protein
MKAVWLLLLAIAPTRAAANCPLVGLFPKVLTKPNTALASDGGVVVAAMPQNHGPLDSGDAAVQPSWRFVVPMGTITPAIDSLAPGLAVYRTSADAFELKDGQGAALVKVTRSDANKPDKLPAPKVKSIKYEAPIARRSFQRVEVRIDGGVPPGVIALVLADAKGTAKSWTLAEGSVFYPYLSTDCMALPNGTEPSRQGERVTLFWVDEHGRKSAYTKPMTIK